MSASFFQEPRGVCPVCRRRVTKVAWTFRRNMLGFTSLRTWRRGARYPYYWRIQHGPHDHCLEFIARERRLAAHTPRS